MRKVGFIIAPGYQPMGFAVTAPFEIANRQAGEPVYDIRMLSKHGGPVRTSLGFQVSTEPFSVEPYDLIIVGASMEDAFSEMIEFIRRVRSSCPAGSLQAATGRSSSRKQGFSTGAAQQPIGFAPTTPGALSQSAGRRRQDLR